MFSYLSRLFWPQSTDPAIRIPSVKIHEIETAVEKSGRALKHLLKLNHANFAVLYNERRFHNHTPHVCWFPLEIMNDLVLTIVAGPEFCVPAWR
jgi:hypothetical protein